MNNVMLEWMNEILEQVKKDTWLLFYCLLFISCYYHHDINPNK